MDQLREMLERGQVNEAEAEAKRRIAANPKDASGHVALAKLSLNNFDAPACEKHLAAAEALGVTPDTLVVRAMLFIAAGDAEQARASYEKACAMPNAPAEAFLGHGLAMAY